MSAEAHPWNEPLWLRLATARRLPHALMLSGAAGLGKLAFAQRLAQWRLCSARDNGTACGLCRGCALFAAGTHPDVHVIAPERLALDDDSLMMRYAMRYVSDEAANRKRKPGLGIGVDAIRRLIDALGTHTHLAEERVVVLTPAHAMSLNAANALLKVLEEPPANTVFALVTSQPMRLPATVRSRCVRLDFSAPPTDEALAWLARQDLPAAGDAALLLSLAGGAPLTALEWAQQGFVAARDAYMNDVETLLAGGGDAIAAAARWKESGAARALRWLHGLLADLVRLRAGAAAAGLNNPDWAERLRTHADRINLKKACRAYDRVGEGRRELAGALDETLTLEDLLIELEGLTGNRQCQ